jgi:hypothetical protein
MGNILTISIYNYRSGQIGYSIEHVPDTNIERVIPAASRTL